MLEAKNLTSRVFPPSFYAFKGKYFHPTDRGLKISTAFILANFDRFYSISAVAEVTGLQVIDIWRGNFQSTAPAANQPKSGPDVADGSAQPSAWMLHLSDLSTPERKGHVNTNKERENGSALSLHKRQEERTKRIMVVYYHNDCGVLQASLTDTISLAQIRSLSMMQTHGTH